LRKRGCGGRGSRYKGSRDGREVVAVVVVRQEANGPLQGGESQRCGMCIISIDLVFNGLSVRAARAALGFGFGMALLAKNQWRHRISVDFQKIDFRR